MNFLSVCSGIEAASVAWKPLGWQAVGFSEIEPFPCAVLAHHYPTVRNFGDLTKWEEWIDDVADFDVLAGGTACQGFSVAGRRGGLDDPRSQLAFDFLGIAGRRKPKWVVWENVPGVLSSDGGRDFGAFLGELGKCGYGFAYRVLDAGYFGVRTPRPRVFVVAYLGDWRPACAALLDPESLGRNQAGDSQPPESQKPTRTPAVFTARGGMAHDDRSNYILDGEGLRTSTPLEWERALGFPDNYTAIPYSRRNRNAVKESKQGTVEEVELIDPLRADSAASRRDDSGPERALCDMRVSVGVNASGDRPRPLERQGARDSVPCVQHKAARCGGRGLADAGVGIPGRTRIAPDGPRYKALGDSWAVPCARWIGERIALAEAAK